MFNVSHFLSVTDGNKSSKNRYFQSVTDGKYLAKTSAVYSRKLVTV